MTNFQAFQEFVVFGQKMDLWHTVRFSWLSAISLWIRKSLMDSWIWQVGQQGNLTIIQKKKVSSVLSKNEEGTSKIALAFITSGWRGGGHIRLTWIEIMQNVLPYLLKPCADFPTKPHIIRGVPTSFGMESYKWNST